MAESVDKTGSANAPLHNDLEHLAGTLKVIVRLKGPTMDDRVRSADEFGIRHRHEYLRGDDAPPEARWISSEPMTEDDIRRGQEVAQEYGWLESQ